MKYKCVSRYNGFTVGRIYSENLNGYLVDDRGSVRDGLDHRRTSFFEKVPVFIQSTERVSPFTEDSAARKGYPVFSGFLEYFPDAVAAVARHSKISNDKHNPNERLHWSREKSADHKDCIGRHLVDHDWVELAWRALANLQIEMENGYEPHPEDRNLKTGHSDMGGTSTSSNEGLKGNQSKHRGAGPQGIHR